ncbi:MAG: 1-(5-phosphoribosyl)-5-[(5-phosphoribosylamino)methylideneamino] imidazole-4-carboxamide isomerase [bacterium]|nr:1-(5-phosphoribosyl)-5-[(5-phosphoribosylamino)methylideneamino] imidazole-4-carboxamide isomerase [bacterium]
MIEIIPAIDIIDGKCVRLTHGDFAQKTVYADDSLEVAKRFEGLGLRRLHMVDLDGAKSGKPSNLAVLERVASATDLVVDFGGGIKTDDDLTAVFEAGAATANIGSVAIREPERFFEWLARFGGDRILLGADAKNGKVAIDGWATETQVDIIKMLSERVARGVRQAFVTDIGSDGAMAGPAIRLYQTIMAAVPELDLIASGGVSSIADVEKLEDIGCSAVIVGKAIYEGRITDEELKRYAR